MLTLSQFQTQFEDAWTRRQGFHQNPHLEAYRVFHGYSEGMPGLSIDRYGDCLVINKKIELPFSDEEVAAILASQPDIQSIVMKTDQRLEMPAGGERVRFLKGSAQAGVASVKEYDARFLYDDHSLHTNGLYLDARPARRWLRQNAGNRRVLNLFAHTGSLGVTAKLGGAQEVVHLDKSKVVMQAIRKNYQLNQLKPDDRGLLHGDLYFHLPRAIKWGQKFSAIILDPPPRVPPPPKAPKHRPRGQDFQTLIGMCCDLLENDAWLLCLYHDYHLNHDQHDEQIIAASEGKLKPYWRDQADKDFPENDPDRATRMTAFRFKH